MTAGSADVLRAGTVVEAGLDPARVAHARAVVAGCLPPSTATGCYPGAVLLLARDGVVGAYEAYGDALRYGPDGETLPAVARVPTRRDTVYDLASLTKTVTAVVVLALAERALLDLDRPVRTVLPAFRGPGKDAVTIRQLLAHTSGLPALIDLWRDRADRAESFARAAGTRLEHAPGTAYVYSDVGPILAGAIVESVTGARLDEVVTDLVTAPLGMTDTGYRPAGSRRDRCAATEAQPWTGRALVRGEVHDENAWALDGVSGHAGLFGTVRDYAILVHLLAAGGADGTRVLAAESVDAMFTDHGWGNGLGVDLDRPATMGALASPSTGGHTGFTGTSYVVDRETRAVGLLFTNRVHPTRDRGVVTTSRVAVAEALLPVRAR